MSTNTGNGNMGLNTGFVKAGSHFAFPLNLAANLTTGAGPGSNPALFESKNNCVFIRFTVPIGLC